MNLRARLTLWYAGVLAGVLTIYAVAQTAVLNHRLYEEIDRGLHEDLEWVEARIARGPDGAPVFDEEEGDEEWGGWIEVARPDGSILFRAVPSSASPLPAADPAGPKTVALEDGAPVRLMTFDYHFGGADLRIRVARPEARLRHERREFLLVMLLGIPLAVALAGAGGYLLARRALAPVGRMADQAREITAERLGDRLALENPADELGRLGGVFNETLARIERSFEALRRFTADAAHELRTPLTAIRSVGEVSLREPGAGDAHREAVGSMLEEVDRMSRLVDTLLTLARGESGTGAPKARAVDLGKLAAEAAEYLGVLAEEKKQSVVVEAAAPVLAKAEPVALRQAVVNLLDNAIKHSPAGAKIRLAAALRGGAAVLEVADDGPGIAPEHRERIFDRFYRVDRARSRETGGAGLGLSIAKLAVESCGGRIELDTEVGRGSTFRIVLARWTEEVKSAPTESRGRGA